MLQYLCDRCKSVLHNPVDGGVCGLITKEIASQGILVIMPVKLGGGYDLKPAHLCEPCISNLADWKINAAWKR